MQLVSLLVLLPLVAAWPVTNPFSSRPNQFKSFQESFNPYSDPWQPITHMDFKQFPYQPPKYGDVRSPCPWLSTCANHGILPRDGKNIHFETLFRCAHFGGFGKTFFRTSRASFSKIVAAYRENDIKEGRKPRPLDRISLDETGLHGPIEHDLSFSRWDVSLTGEMRNLNATNAQSNDLILGLLKYAEKKPNCKTTVTKEWLEDPNCKPADTNCYIDTEDMGHWYQERRRMEQQRISLKQRGSRNEIEMKLPWNLKEFVAAIGEATFFVRMMGRKGKIPLEHAKSFLMYQRIPSDWTPPGTKHFALFAPKITLMADSYLKKRRDGDDKYSKSYNAVYFTPEVIHNAIIADYQGNGKCSGDTKACPKYDPNRSEESSTSQ